MFEVSEVENNWLFVENRMPTTAESPGLSHRELRHSFQGQTSNNWTDDLPVCHLSGIGQSTNQIYREDGQRQQQHDFEDMSFRFKTDPDTYLYGLFDGHDGCLASSFAAQRMPAELLLGQLSGKNDDEDVREALQQAFIAVEKGFFQSIDDLLAEKANLQLELPDGLSPYQTYQQFPDVVGKLRVLDAQIAGGTTAVLALIHDKKLFVANVGDSRALLCRRANNGILEVEQLTVDHNVHNEDELLRLKQLSLDVERIRHWRKLGNQENTRCIGNYTVKGGYKDFDMLSCAGAEPVIAEPDVCGGIPINGTFRFLLLMSNGLYRSYEQATGKMNVNQEIAEMVLEQFSSQSTLMGVAQAVVDRIVRIHHDTHVSDPSRSQQRDDMTLVVRSFDEPLPNALTGRSDVQQPGAVGMHARQHRPLERKASAVAMGEEEGRIEPYVDFKDFFKAVETARLLREPGKEEEEEEEKNGLHKKGNN